MILDTDTKYEPKQEWSSGLTWDTFDRIEFKAIEACGDSPPYDWCEYCEAARALLNLRGLAMVPR